MTLISDKQVECIACGGTGGHTTLRDTRIGDEHVECPRCSGSGTLSFYRHIHLNDEWMPEDFVETEDGDVDWLADYTRAFTHQWGRTPESYTLRVSV